MNLLQPERGVHAASTSENLPGLLRRESAVFSVSKRPEARAPQPERGVHAASTSEYLPGLLLRESAAVSLLKRAEARAPQRGRQTNQEKS
jgi:hypothetical protein